MSWVLWVGGGGREGGTQSGGRALKAHEYKVR